jgi:hypothetical protein
LIGIGWILDRSDDQVHQLEENTKRWRQRWWEELGEALAALARGERQGVG